MVVNDSEGGNCSNGESGGIHSNMEHSGSHSKGGSHGSTMCNGNTNKPENSSCEISNHENERTRSENEERIQILEVCNHDNRKKSVPRKFSSFGGAVRRKMSIVPDDATPVQWKMILLIFISLFSSAFSLTFLFPFLPEMILFFGYKEEDKGYYAGLVASAVFAGRAFGSYFWGWLSDKYGRRPVVLITVIANGLFSLIFGFTINLPMAIITRFLTGLVNGTVGTAKTMLYEISDDTNQAVGMSLLGMSWGAGVILGPTIGGLLASPAGKYPDVFPVDGAFGRFPYLLPSLFVAGACFIVFVIDFFLLPETMASKKNIQTEISVPDNKDKTNSATDNHCAKPGTAENVSLLRPEDRRSGMISMSVEDLYVEADTGTYKVQWMQSHENLPRKRTFSESCHTRAPKNRQIHEDVKGSLPNIVRSFSGPQSSKVRSLPKIVIENEVCGACNGHSRTVTEEGRAMLPRGSDESGDAEGAERSGCTKVLQRIKRTSLVILFSIPEVREAVFLYTVFSFAIIGFEEIFTVWASTKIWFGGLGFDPAKIGMVLGITAVPMLLLNLYIFPFLVRKFGLKKTFIAASILNGFVVTAVPSLHLIHANEVVLWTLLLVLIIPQKIFNSCCFSATSLFVNNSSPKHLAGAVNGIAMTWTAVARTLAPAVGGSVFAWSVGYGSTNIGPPFDVNLSFFLFGLVLWLTGIYSIYLSESLNRQKK